MSPSTNKNTAQRHDDLCLHPLRERQGGRGAVVADSERGYTVKEVRIRQQEVWICGYAHTQRTHDAEGVPYTRALLVGEP
jgi:hypothetical protein